MDTFDLHDAYESNYHAAGPDQMALAGTPAALIRALSHSTIGSAARDLADFLTTSNTVYARYHNTYLTDAVLDATSNLE